jgi:hypothetical protein
MTLSYGLGSFFPGFFAGGLAAAAAASFLFAFFAVEHDTATKNTEITRSSLIEKFLNVVDILD